MLTRRSLFLASLSLLASRPVLASTGTSERWLWAMNRAGEEVAVAYRNHNGYNPIALARFAHLFRDLREDVAGPMPPLLIDLLSVLQERWGYRQPLIIGSGYRTPRTNASIEGAAPASMHLRGFAADITMRGVHPDQLAATAWLLSRQIGFMGLGLYSGFLHVDIGPQRYWTRWK